MRGFLAAVCLILFDYSQPYAYDENFNEFEIYEAQLNVESLTSLYLIVADLMNKFEQNNMPHYSRFFNAALMREVRLLFRQIYGYAANETQGIEWEADAVRYLQLFVIHLSSDYLKECYEGYMLTQSKNVSTPVSLQLQCVSYVRRQMATDLNETFGYAAHPLLLYELMRFSNLPVIISSTKKWPYLIIRLRIDKNYGRFLDEKADPSTLNKANAYNNPVPFSPTETLKNEISLFHRAQSCVVQILRSMEDGNRLLTASVDANLITRVDHFFANYYIKFTALQRYSLSRNVFVLFFADFLEREYERLTCHPAFQNFDNNTTQLREEIISQQKFLIGFSKNLRHIVWTRDCNLTVSCAQRAVYTSVECEQPLVGYSLWRVTGIALVKNRRLSDASTQVELPLNPASMENLGALS